jgi:hypothetical protein
MLKNIQEFILFLSTADEIYIYIYNTVLITGPFLELVGFVFDAQTFNF